MAYRVHKVTPSDYLGNSLVEKGTTLGVPVSFADTPSLDAFSRLRVSNPVSLFNHTNAYGLDDDIFETVASGAGSGITYLPNENSNTLAVGTVDGEYTIRQTFQYFPYTPGKSQLIFQTAVLGAGVTNVVKRIGYFDNENGLFFEQSGTTLNVVRRTFTSGSIVDNVVAQANWNLDKLDGTGVSGITLDVTKTQIFIIDFQWLGVGRVRFGFDIDGSIHYCHEMVHANNLTMVYMTTPRLPIRYEIRNVGLSTGTTLKQICSSVTSEGGIVPEGEQFAASSGTTTVAVTTRRPIFAIRMATTINGKTNRKIAKLMHTHLRTATNDAFVEVMHCHNPSSVTATWTSAGSDSGVEYSTDISAATFAESHRMAAFFSVAGAIGSSAESATEQSDIINEHDRVSLDYAGTTSTYLVVYATSFTLTSNIATSMGWIEY